VLGYAREALAKTATAFSRGEDALNDPRCDFTHRMNGTSAAAAVASGVVALMRSANPQLGWRDVRDILAPPGRSMPANVASALHGHGRVAVDRQCRRARLSLAAVLRVS